MNTENNKVSIILNSEENHIKIHESDLEIEFDVVDDNRNIFAIDAKIGLTNYDTTLIMDFELDKIYNHKIDKHRKK